MLRRGLAGSKSSKSPRLARWFNFLDGEAVHELDEIRAGETLQPTWKLTPQQVHEIWVEYDPEHTGVVEASKLPGLTERLMEVQRKALSTIIIEERKTKTDLLGDLSSWLPKWKQWGVTVELKDHESTINAAEHLLVGLHDPAVAEGILDALCPNADGSVTHFNFMSTVISGSLKDAELDVMKAKAEATEAAKAAEPAIAAAHTAEEKRGQTSEPDEDLDFMDLLAALDLLDYSTILFEQQIETVEDLKLLTKEDVRDMGFSVGAGNRLYKWVKKHREEEDE